MEYENITRRRDGSYVVGKCGMPYHIPRSWPEWAEVEAYAQAHPGEVSEEQAPAEPTLAERKAAKRAEIWGAGDAILAQVKANFTQAEIESWSKQEQGAKDIQAEETTTEAAQFVAAIAQARGLEVSVLVTKILANVASYGALSAAVIGEQQRLDDLIKTAATAEAVAAITWTYAPPAA